MVSKGIIKEEVDKAVRDTGEGKQRFISPFNIFLKKVNGSCEEIFGTISEEVPLSAYHEKLKVWKAEIKRIQPWAQYIACCHACLKTEAGPLIALIGHDIIEPEDIRPCFEGNFAEAFLSLAFEERPELANFYGALHEDKIKRFRELDSELIDLNRLRLVRKLRESQPQISRGASPGSEDGILLGEFNRKRRHMPIRKLMKLAGGLIQRIKPCFLMSPLSVAQFLDPQTVLFDVIIFDEASQVRPEDALGAILRGKQVIVMGDTRQLPPTSFFDHIVDSADGGEYEEDLTASISDMESILHQCSRCFPSRILNWHYRSKHESLIAVSNQEFYDNQLRIYPSPIDKAKNIGLQFIHLPDSVYDRGRSSVNHEEAKAVARAALEHYRMSPDKSLGVGTFNIKQQQAIIKEIELLLHLNPEMEVFFKNDQKEHFFVKNLETIQGDERDVIYLSIGFGFDQNRTRVKCNFGALNHQGGERRLNVLISRARECCVVFSNFRADDLAIDESAPFGLRSLKVFLDYAENRNLSGIEASRADADSPFEDSVYDFLRSHNFEVRKQIGCAGFRVDLGVVDSEHPGRYVLGIECDGAKYHSSPVARDRDRLRQQILENKGWRIYRIWSTDWYRNCYETKNKLLEAIRRARLEKKSYSNPHKQSVSIFKEETKEPADFSAVEDRLDKLVSDYEICSSLGIPVYGELHTYPVSQLSKAVIQVVDIEGPVHFDEIVHRIRDHWGLGRAGQRIRKAISTAASIAEQESKVKRKGGFFWSIQTKPLQVRRRCGDPPARIELICSEEIAEAVKLVLKVQFATMMNDLVIKASRALGFQVTHDATADHIKAIIEDLLKKGELQQMPNGMINL